MEATVTGMPPRAAAGGPGMSSAEVESMIEKHVHRWRRSFGCAQGEGDHGFFTHPLRPPGGIHKRLQGHWHGGFELQAPRALDEAVHVGRIHGHNEVHIHGHARYAVQVHRQPAHHRAAHAALVQAMEKAGTEHGSLGVRSAPVVTGRWMYAAKIPRRRRGHGERSSAMLSVSAPRWPQAAFRERAFSHASSASAPPTCSPSMNTWGTVPCPVTAPTTWLRTVWCRGTSAYP